MMKDEVKKWLDRALGLLREHRYAALVLLLGLVLLLLPAGDGGERQETPEEQPAAVAADDTEERLRQILSLIEGAGEVRVLLTPANDGERVLAVDTDRRVTERDGELTETYGETHLTLPRSGGGSEAVEVERRARSWRGAVVACQGADSARVRLEITEAVKAATGLTGDSITIIKMKQEDVQ